MPEHQRSVDDFFSGQDLSRALFEVLRAAIEEVGPAELRVTKSQIAFRRRRLRETSRSRGFAWVWIPGMYLRGKTAPLVLSVALPIRDPSPRWKQVVEPYAGRFIHHLELRDPAEIDDQVRMWLHLAWSSAG